MAKKTGENLAPRRAANISGRRSDLTELQYRFCEYFAAGDTQGRARDSAVKAGYQGGPKVASARATEMLAMPKIQEQIRKLQIKVNRKQGVTVDSILNDLKRLQQKAEDEGNYPSALKATELLGKHLAMFTDRIEHVRSIEEVSTEELLGLVSELRAKLEPATKDALTGLLRGDRQRAQSGS